MYKSEKGSEMIKSVKPIHNNVEKKAGSFPRLFYLGDFKGHTERPGYGVFSSFLFYSTFLPTISYPFYVYSGIFFSQKMPAAFFF